MKQRFTFSIIFGILGFIISLPFAFIIGGFLAGILYFSVVGDSDPYNLSDLMMVVPAIIGLLSILIITSISGYFGFKYGKEKENTSSGKI